jgi:hypothetical protein
MSHAELTPANDFDTTTTILLSQPNTILVDALRELVECHILLQPACALWIFNANTTWELIRTNGARGFNCPQLKAESAGAIGTCSALTTFYVVKTINTRTTQVSRSATYGLALAGGRVEHLTGGRAARGGVQPAQRRPPRRLRRLGTSSHRRPERRLRPACADLPERWLIEGSPLYEVLGIIDQTQKRLREGNLSEVC